MAVVYFDGVCNLCNGFVDYLIRRDKAGVLRFAPLQGATARLRLTADVRDSLSSVVFEDDANVAKGGIAVNALGGGAGGGGKVSLRSEAALRAIAAIGGLHRGVLIFLWIVPTGLRDWVYNRVADNRYKWFGQRDTCRLPTAWERSHFLD
jgi:predicted DCC family thiol-disulfide oxidoreductase YuxK